MIGNKVKGDLIVGVEVGVNGLAVGVMLETEDVIGVVVGVQVGVGVGVGIKMQFEVSKLQDLSHSKSPIVKPTVAHD